MLLGAGVCRWTSLQASIPDEPNGLCIVNNIVVKRGSIHPVASAADERITGVILSSNRYVLALGLIAGLIAPLLFIIQPQALDRMIPTLEHFAPTFACCLLAIVTGHFSVQRIAALPLISSPAVVVPSFMASYGFSYFVLYVTKVPLGVKPICVSLFVVIGLYMLLSVLRAKHLHPVVGIIGVDKATLEDLPESVAWLPLEQPQFVKGITAIAYDPHADLSMRWSSFITKMVLKGVPVYHLSHIVEGLTGRVRFNNESENEFGALLPSLFYLRLKRTLDLLLAIVLLPIFLAIILLAGLAIRAESPGAAIFRQVRIGHRGKPFVCYKLRTMRSDIKGPDFTVDRDPRITKLGSYMRKWRIDELPQIFNVIKGEMSWIGPRPEALKLAKHYARHVPFYGYRHAVRPGITGWAAVHQGNVAQVAAATEKLEYDFFYIRYFSVWLDILIIFKTVMTVLTGFGSK